MKLKLPVLALSMLLSFSGGASAEYQMIVNHEGVKSPLSTPTILSVNPSRIGVAGDAISLIGQEFTAESTVHLDTNPATVSFADNTNILFQAPAAPAGPVDVLVTNPDGSTFRLQDGLTYVEAPVLSGVSPVSGSMSGGDLLTLSGSGFDDGTTVLFDGVAVTTTYNQDGTLSMTTPTHAAGSVQIDVSNEFGADFLANAFEFLPAPDVTDRDVTSGSTTGGQVIVLTGTGFTPDTTVTFGDTPATAVVVDSNTQLTVTQPAHIAGKVDLITSNSYGTDIWTNGFTFVAPPTVADISPATGSIAGGDTIIIIGTDFTESSRVFIGGVRATDEYIDTPPLDTQLTVVTPPGVVGTADVRVKTYYGQVTETAAFEYGESPEALALSKSSGSTAGGDTVVITGNNFTDPSYVMFGGVFSENVVIDSDTQITAVTPAHDAGLFDVRVLNGYGESRLSGAYTYGDPAVISVVDDPSSGESGGETRTVTGSGFTPASVVGLGGNMADTTYIGPTEMTFVVPAHDAGRVQLGVYNEFGWSNMLPSDFTYYAAPAITDLSITGGSTNGGETVTLTGSDFTADTAVSFDATPATSVTFVDDTTITVVAPAHIAGTVDITVSNAYGSTVFGNAYSFYAPPVLTSLSVTEGHVDGGTTVVLTGENFTANMNVRFGGTLATSITIDSDTQATVVTPAHAAGGVLVYVANIFGNDSIGGGFVYHDAPELLASASQGSALPGGTKITLTGNGFTPDMAVHFGDTPSPDVTYVSSTEIRPTVPAHDAGQVDLTVSNNYGSSTLVNAFFYKAPPSITSISETTGGTAGGDVITITGVSFAGSSGTTVYFGGVASPNVVVASGNQSMDVTVPAHVAGTVNIRIVTWAGEVTENNAFTFVDPIAASSLSKNNGSTNGGETITISGSGFSGNMAVTFGGTPATSVTVNSATQLTVVTPARTWGLIDVVVSNEHSSDTLVDAYQFFVPPTVTSISESSGFITGGDTLVITGSHFRATGTSVTIGGTAASFTRDDSTQLTVTTPAKPEGTYDVVVTTAYGNDGLTNAYTYLPTEYVVPNGNAGAAFSTQNYAIAWNATRGYFSDNNAWDSNTGNLNIPNLADVKSVEVKTTGYYNDLASCISSSMIMVAYSDGSWKAIGTNDAWDAPASGQNVYRGDQSMMSMRTYNIVDQVYTATTPAGKTVTNIYLKSHFYSSYPACKRGVKDIKVSYQ